MKYSFFAVGLGLLVSASALAVQLKPETANAFDRYITAYEAQRFQLPGFLESQETAQRRQQLKNGEVVVFPGKNNGDVDVPSGLIHDWVGAIFVPGVTLDKVLTVIQDYSHQSQVYAPDIAASKLRSHQGNDDFEVYMKVVKSKYMLSDVLNTEHKIHFTRVSPDRVYCRSYSTRVAEISNPGTKNEHELPVGNDRGYLWRLYGYWFFEQKDGGVYIEYESISLSRDVPLMGRLIGPVLHSLPAESLRTSMEKTRKAVEATAVRGTN